MELYSQFLFNILILSGINAVVYFLGRTSRSFIISLAILNLVIFILSIIFRSQEISIGSGLGMFALFTLIRYRSEQLKLTEISYILIAICVGILNAVYPGILTFFQIAILEISILVILMILLKVFNPEQILYKIKYEKLELLKTGKSQLLKRDLQNRLGGEISKIDIESINFPEQYANLKVTLSGNSYKTPDENIMLIDKPENGSVKNLYSAS